MEVCLLAIKICPFDQRQENKGKWSILAQRDLLKATKVCARRELAIARKHAWARIHHVIAIAEIDLIPGLLVVTGILAR